MVFSTANIINGFVKYSLFTKLQRVLTLWLLITTYPVITNPGNTHPCNSSSWFILYNSVIEIESHEAT